MNRNFHTLFSKKGTFLPLSLSLIVVGCFSAFTYSQYSSNVYVDVDGFSYLNTVGSVWNTISGGSLYWVDHLRSPLLILFIPPQLNIARFAMIGYLLISTLFIFFLTQQLTKRVDLAFIASVSFGTIPYLLDFTRKVMSDLPAITLFLAGLYFFLHGFDTQRTRSRDYLLSSALMGFSFVVRFDMAIMILPIFILLLLKDRKNLLTYLAPFLCIGVVLELLSTYLYTGQLQYQPWNFVYSNFFTNEYAVSHISNASFLYYLPFAFASAPILLLLAFLSLYIVFKKRDVKILLIAAIFLFLTVSFFVAPKTDPRVYLINYFPIATLLSAVFLTAFLKKKFFITKRTSIQRVSILVILLSIMLIPNVVLQTQFPYSSWNPQNPMQQLVSSGELSNRSIISNLPQATIYFLATANDGSKPLRSLNRVERIDCILLPNHNVTMLANELDVKNCDLLLYFQYPEISNFNQAELTYLMQNYRFEIMSCGGYNLYIFRLH